ncbi:MAG TPA: PaaI family thioesterase [Pseudomonas xinjiangensis]|uniref:PaaI family thioesterase n=2 Tax=root TaxID=1 RepID=A0A7V1BME0_9GAMM|nr:PaaI family thioesterase [Halopseudomonas xinjiangensis]HEC49262.1 PaaI family thioesterase [Halopseudomonas xinjiangensis]
MTVTDIPDGYALHSRHSGLTEPWEPIYFKITSDDFRLGIRAATVHANSRGFVHGGLLSALADNAMGLACAQQIKTAAGLLTVSLTMDFLGTAQIGQWIEIRAEPLKLGRSLCFANALILAEGEICARASGVFRLMSRQDQASISDAPNPFD